MDLNVAVEVELGEGWDFVPEAAELQVQLLSSLDEFEVGLEKQQQQQQPLALPEAPATAPAPAPAQGALATPLRDLKPHNPKVPTKFKPEQSLEEVLGRLRIKHCAYELQQQDCTWVEDLVLLDRGELERIFTQPIFLRKIAAVMLNAMGSLPPNVADLKPHLETLKFFLRSWHCNVDCEESDQHSEQDQASCATASTPKKLPPDQNRREAQLMFPQPELVPERPPQEAASDASFSEGAGSCGKRKCNEDHEEQQDDATDIKRPRPSDGTGPAKAVPEAGVLAAKAWVCAICGKSMTEEPPSTGDIGGMLCGNNKFSSGCRKRVSRVGGLGKFIHPHLSQTQATQKFEDVWPFIWADANKEWSEVSESGKAQRVVSPKRVEQLRRATEFLLRNSSHDGMCLPPLDSTGC